MTALAASARKAVSAERQKRSSGNVFVEGALVLLPSIALLTGFFDVTFATFTWSVLQNAVREGCRYAVTYQTSGSNGQDASIEAVVSQFSMGFLVSGSPYIQVNYFSQTALTTPLASPGGNSPGNIVEVSVQNYPLQWVAPISGTINGAFRDGNPAVLNVYADDVMGALPTGVPTVPR